VPYVGSPYDRDNAQWILAAGRAIAHYVAELEQLLKNKQQEFVERNLEIQKGVPERAWFKNQIYAPGAYTGYGAKPIAAVREAEAQVPQVAEVIERAVCGPRDRPELGRFPEMSVVQRPRFQAKP